MDILLFLVKNSDDIFRRIPPELLTMEDYGNVVLEASKRDYRFVGLGTLGPLSNVKNKPKVIKFKYKDSTTETILTINKNKSPNDLLNDRDFMLNAIKIDCRSIRLASKELISNYDFMLDAIKIDHRSIHSTPKELLNNYDFMLGAIKIDNRSIHLTSKELLNNRSFMLDVVKINCNSLRHASKELRNDIYFMLDAIKIDESSSKYAYEIINNNYGDIGFFEVNKNNCNY